MTINNIMMKEMNVNTKKLHNIALKRSNKKIEYKKYHPKYLYPSYLKDDYYEEY